MTKCIIIKENKIPVVHTGHKIIILLKLYSMNKGGANYQKIEEAYNLHPLIILYSVIQYEVALILKIKTL